MFRCLLCSYHLAKDILIYMISSMSHTLLLHSFGHLCFGICMSLSFTSFILLSETSFSSSLCLIYFHFLFFLSKSKFYLKVLRKERERIKERNLHLRDCRLLQRWRMPMLKCESTYLKRRDAGQQNPDKYLGSMYPGKMCPYLFS